jgi:hypothetical protein
LPATTRSIIDSRPSQPVAPTGPASASSEAPSQSSQVVVPSIVQSILFDDNIYATRRNKTSDFAYVVRPDLSFATSGSDYGFQANAFAERRQYFKNSDESQTNAGASLGGTYQFTPDSQVQARASYLRGHEERGSGEEAFFRPDRPTAFNQFDGAVALNNRYGALWTSLGLAGLYVNYEDPKIGGVSIDQSYRDGGISVANGRVGYVVAPLTSVFVELAGNRRDFKEDYFSSDGYRVVGGVLLEPGPGARVKGEAWGGFMRQTYKGATLSDISSFTYGGSLSFLVTDDLTLTVEGRREAKESGLNGGVSLIESYGGGRLDYQLMENLFVGGGVTYLVDSFKDAGRKDHYWSPLASLKYVASKNITLGLEYRRLSFHTDDPLSSQFRRNVALASVTARF